jgi:Sporulation and spore germination
MTQPPSWDDDREFDDDDLQKNDLRNNSNPLIPRHLVIGIAVLFVAVLATSVYVWRMRGRAAAIPVASTDARPVAPPIAGPTERVTLFVAHDEDGTLRAEAAQIPLPSGRQQRSEELLRALLSLYLDKSSPHSLPAGSDVRSVYLVSPGLAVIDLNAAVADGHRSGVLVEELTVTSLIRTISFNTPDVLKVKILIDGKERDTLAGHADLSDFYDVTAVNQLAAQLQSP